jgi:hypothetical protein
MHASARPWGNTSIHTDWLAILRQMPASLNLAEYVSQHHFYDSIRVVINAGMHYWTLKWTIE